MQIDVIWKTDKMQFDIPKNKISDFIFTLARQLTVYSALCPFNDTKHDFIDVQVDISSSKFNLLNANEHDSCQTTT